MISPLNLTLNPRISEAPWDFNNSLCTHTTMSSKAQQVWTHPAVSTEEVISKLLKLNLNIKMTSV